MWSPDGKQMAYASGTRLYVKDVGGATDAKLIKPYSGNAQVLRTTNCPPCFGGRFLEQCGGKRDCIVGVTVDQVCDAVMSASAISRSSEPMASGAAAAET